MYTEDEYDFCKYEMSINERILWKGKPDKGNFFTTRDIFTSLVALLWIGFAVFWTHMVLQENSIFALIGIVLIIVGIYLLVGRFFHMAYRRKNSRYVITNKKIMRKIGKKVDSLSSVSLPAFHTTLYRNGNGTIIFETANPYNRNRKTVSIGYDTTSFSLENVENISHVLQAIEQMDH